MLIVKDQNGMRSKKKDQKFRVAVCSDGSEQSIKALNFMTRIMDRRRGDQLIVICVKTSKVNPEDVSNNVNHYFSPLDEVTLCLFSSFRYHMASPTS